MTKKTRGFSLMELMVVVAVIGIVAAIAYPSYNGYVTRSRQAAAQQFMMDIANAEETYRADALQYVAGVDTNTIKTTLNLRPSDETVRYYTFVVDNATATTYTITATPQNGQTGPVLTLNQAGEKTGW